MLQQSGLLAERVRAAAGDDVSDQIKSVFQLAFVRSPDDGERMAAIRLVKQHGLETLCRAIFNSNEFLFLP